jgi:hypothetical protein
MARLPGLKPAPPETVIRSMPIIPNLIIFHLAALLRIEMEHMVNKRCRKSRPSFEACRPSKKRHQTACEPEIALPRTHPAPIWPKIARTGPESAPKRPVSARIAEPD